jgi:acyl-CoA thioesterase FadM
MGRVRLELPTEFQFSTDIPVRITDVNYGGHLGNDALLGMLHEARVQFLQHLGCSEQNVEGVGIIMADAVVVYRSETFYGDLLKVEVTAAEPQRTGCDLLYRVTRADNGREVARAKTGIVFFDYGARKVTAMPPGFRAAVFPVLQS